MLHSGLIQSGSTMRLTLTAWRYPLWLVPVLYGLSAMAFVSDVLRDNNLAYGMFYAPLVATSVFHRGRWGLWVITVTACLMVVIGAFLPAISPDLQDMIGNRVLSILTIIATAAFVHHARETQERLAATTRRAEAAERIKTDVLINLSREIGTPLHALLGVLSLTMASSTPDQRETLGRVRRDGKELLATIDNLLDLAQIGERTLRRQTVDISTIARDAAESARGAATERQINISLDPGRESGDAAAIGDSWAMRRILDNLLANAVRLTPPGGTVSVSVERGPDTVIASVSDTGMGLPPGLTLESLALESLAPDFRPDAGRSPGEAAPATGGTGLALSSRLAAAMNGRLTARNRPNAGATVSLSLPAA